MNLLSSECSSLNVFTNFREKSNAFLITLSLVLQAHNQLVGITGDYYMALACGRYNVRSDWLIVTEL